MNRNDIKWRMKVLFSANTFLYSKLIGLAKRREIFVNEKTDLVIEGYPRSGNTFGVALLKVLQPDIRLARHRHESGHVKLALTMKKPVVLLLRNPKDAAISFHIREDVSLYTALSYYLDFHKSLLKYRKALLVVDFEELTKFPERYIENLNRYFGFDFQIPEKHHIQSAKILVADMDKEEFSKNRNFIHRDISMISSVPSQKKDLRKKEVEKLLQNSSTLQTLLQKSDTVYQTLKGSNEGPSHP